MFSLVLRTNTPRSRSLLQRGLRILSSSNRSRRVKSRTVATSYYREHGIVPRIRVLELFGRYGRMFHFDQATTGSTRMLTLLHGMGRKWSLFYEGMLETMLSESLEGKGVLETMLSESLEGEVKRFSLTSTDNQVVAEISMDPLKSLQQPADDIFKRLHIPMSGRERQRYRSSDLSPIARETSGEGRRGSS